MMKSSNNFFQPVISVFGLAISLLTAILPLFSKETLTKLFVKQSLAQPISFLSFIIGIAIIWQITEFQPFINISLGKFRERGKGFPEPWKRIGSNLAIWILLFIAIILAFLFLIFSASFVSSEPNTIASMLQSLFYLLFFLTLIAIFSILFSQTKQRFVWQENRDNFSLTVFETLEKHRLIKPWIEIYENRPMTFKEMEEQGFANVGIARKMRVRTSIQEEEIIEFIVSHDGKEILKVLKKGK